MGMKSQLLKQFLVFVNAFLLAFEPTAWALAKGEQNQIKEFLEETQITQREVSLKEFYQKISAHLPDDVKLQFEEMIKDNPDAVMPKFNVSRIKGPGNEEDIQLQFVKEKSSGVLTILGRGDNFAKVGNSTLTYQDVIQSDRMFAKLNQEFPNPKRGVANNGPAFKVMSHKDFQKLELHEQKAYMKNLRDILEATESLQNSQIPQGKETSSFLFFELLVPEAIAQPPKGSDEYKHNAAVSGLLRVGDPCIFAGHMADYGCKNSAVKEGKKCTGSNGYVCGGEGSKFGAKIKGELACDGGTGVLCNTDIYGDSKACAKRTVNATKECNEKSKKYDYFDSGRYLSSDQWEAQKDKLESVVRKQQDFCADLTSGTKKALADQAATCTALNSRIDLIRKTVCPFEGGDVGAQKDIESYSRKNRFKDSYCAKKEVVEVRRSQSEDYDECPKKDEIRNKDGKCIPCKEGGGSTKGGECVPPSGPAQNTVTVPPTGDPDNKCEPDSWYKSGEQSQDLCRSTGGTVVNCGKEGFWKCSCTKSAELDTKTGVPDRCQADVNGGKDGKDKSGTGSYKPKEKSFWDKNKSWIMPTLVGGLFLGLMYWGMKSSLKSQYDLLTPKPTATPVPSTSPTPRTRGVK